MSLIEIEGYKAQMDAIYRMERHDYEDALNHLLKAKLIFEKIASYQDTLEALIYGEKVSQISTFIRSCASSLSLGADADEIQLQDAKQLVSKIESANELSNKSKSADTDMSDGSGDVKINGRVIPLKSARLRDAFNDLTKKMDEVVALRQNNDIESKQQIAAIQLSLVNQLDEVVKLITKEKKEEQMRSDASGGLYNTILAHV